MLIINIEIFTRKRVMLATMAKLKGRNLSDLWGWIINLLLRKRSNQWNWLDTRAMELPGTFEAVIKENLTRFFDGMYQKKTLFQRMFPIGAGIYVGLLFLSWLLFPGAYSLAVNTISDLGNPIKNPSGFWYFSAAFIYLAFFNIPFYRFVHKRLAPLSKLLARFALLANIAASGGFIAMATFSNVNDATLTIHIPAAVVSFGGLVVGGLIYWIVIVKDAILKTGTRRIIPLVGAMTNIVVGIAVFQLFDFSTFSVKNLSDLALVAPWEWTLFFAIGANMFMLFRSVPEIEKKTTIYHLVAEQKYCAPEDVLRVFANHLPEDGGSAGDGQEFSYDS
jgi:hypothetical protein